MMEYAPLAASAVSLLTTFIGKALDKGAEEAGKAAINGVIRKFKEILGHAGAVEALEDLQQQPNEADIQAALRRQLVKAITADPKLAENIKSWLEEAKPHLQVQSITQTSTVNGNGNTVLQITGSGHSVQL